MVYNECDFFSCSTGFSCVDANLSDASLGDFICSCPDRDDGRTPVSEVGGNPSNCSLPPIESPSSPDTSLGAGIIVLIVIIVLLCLIMLGVIYYYYQRQWSKKGKHYADNSMWAGENQINDPLNDPQDNALNASHNDSLLKIVTVTRKTEKEKPGITVDDDCVVTNVREDSPYGRADVTKGMKILEINGRLVRTKRDVGAAMKNKNFFSVKLSLQHADDGVPRHVNTDPASVSMPHIEHTPSATSSMLHDHINPAASLGVGTTAFESLAKERDALAKQLSSLSARLHPDSCTFCEGSETFGNGSPARLGDSTAAGCLPLAMVQAGWDSSLNDEEKRLRKVASDLKSGGGGGGGGGGDLSPTGGGVGGGLLSSASVSSPMPNVRTADLLSSQLNSFAADSKLGHASVASL